MKILIVEPHPDDAFLSLGWHIEKTWKDYERTIVTVYSNERRTEEAKAYATAVGAASIALGLEETKMLGEGDRKAEPALRTLLEGLELDIVVLPLGLQHPDHHRVARTRTGFKCWQLWRYCEVPYQFKQKLAEEFQKKIEGKEVVSAVWPNKRKWRHVPIFKSQSKFFHFNPIEGLQGMELVVK